MNVEFVIRVTVVAEDACAAYNALEDCMNNPGSPFSVWGSETYAVDGGESKDTEELFMEVGCRPVGPVSEKDNTSET